MIRVISKGTSCLNYSCSLATALQGTGGRRSSHSRASSGSVCLGTCMGLEVFTSHCLLGVSAGFEAYFAYIPRATCSEVLEITGSTNLQELLRGREQRASDKCSQRNNVSLQVELLVKSASTDRRNNAGQVINLLGSEQTAVSSPTFLQTPF